MITRTERLSPMSRMRIPRLPIQGLIRRCLIAAGTHPEEQVSPTEATATPPATTTAQSTNISNSYYTIHIPDIA